MFRIRLDRVEAEEMMSNAMKDPRTNLNADSISGQRAAISFSPCGTIESSGVLKGENRDCRSVEMQPVAVRRYCCQFSLPPLKVLHVEDISILLWPVGLLLAYLKEQQLYYRHEDFYVMQQRVTPRRCARIIYHHIHFSDGYIVVTALSA